MINFHIISLLFVLEPVDFASLASIYYESVLAMDNKASLNEVAKQMSSLFGGMDTSQQTTTQQEHQKINEAMKIGQVAQSSIAGRADIHVSLKALFIDHFKKISLDGAKSNLDDLTSDAITIVMNPGISILPEIQSMAATPDMLIVFRDVYMTVEIKTTGHYEAVEKELKVYLPQCQMQMFCTGAIGGVLLLANATNMTMKNVEELALICDTHIHLIVLSSQWQKQAKASCQFARALSELAVPQLYQVPSAPDNVNKALQRLPGTDGTVLQRVGRTLRLSGCKAELMFKHVLFDSRGSKYPHVRASLSLDSAAANAINLRIKQNGQMGVYLIASQLEHSGCPTPISADKQYSPKEWSNILDDIADLSKKGVSAAKITLHLEQKYRLKKTTQDVTNLLSKMETFRLVNERKVLPTNAAKLMDALDIMPVVSIGLYDVVSCNAAKTLVMQIVRLKYYANDELRISYVKFQSWGLLKESIQHSLLQLLENPKLPSICTHSNLIKGTLTTSLTPIPYYTPLVEALYL